MADNRPRSRERFGLGVLICIHIVICCVSLIYVADNDLPIAFEPATFHIFFDPAKLHIAVLAVAAFALVSTVFVFARFSPGYFVGFYFYTVVLSYLWLSCFTDLNYDHRLARLSAALSAVAFLLPVLFVTSPVRQVYVLSAAAFDRGLMFILLFAVATVAAGAVYNFRIIGIRDIYDFRDKLESPTILNYAIGMAIGALLPFAFAGFVARGAYWRAASVLLLLFSLYPVTFSKVALFAPFWLLGLLISSKLVEARIVVILSLLIPILGGIFVVSFFRPYAALYLSIINFRMIAIPAVAIDVYNDFFSRHDLTYFCQVSVLKTIMHCAYPDQLAVVLERAYKIGNFNGSLFATEGIASVGPLFAPISVFGCGLVIAIGNRLSAGLPAGFIMVSGAIIPLVLLNVPLTIALLTHGAGLLFLLWYITPRAIFVEKNCFTNRPRTTFEQKASMPTAPAPRQAGPKS
jgi:hypothetical protein